MDKGYYADNTAEHLQEVIEVAIHNKNGQGLLLGKASIEQKPSNFVVAIHNKNGQGLLQENCTKLLLSFCLSQSTIKMDKGYY